MFRPLVLCVCVFLTHFCITIGTDTPCTLHPSVNGWRQTWLTDGALVFEDAAVNLIDLTDGGLVFEEEDGSVVARKVEKCLTTWRSRQSQHN